MANLRKKGNLFLTFKIADRPGILANISGFVSKQTARINRAEASYKEDESGQIDLYCDILATGVLAFLDNLDIFCCEQLNIIEYRVFSRVGKKPTLLRERTLDVHHKNLLIKSVSHISEALLSRIKKDNKLVYQIPSHVFEELVAEIFARQGFKVELTKRSRDGGKDIIAVKYDLGIPSSWVVECKRFNQKKVDIRLVRELFGVKQATGYDHAVLVSTSSFTEPAMQFERTVWGLSLRDYNALMTWLSDYSFSESGGLYLSGSRISSSR